MKNNFFDIVVIGNGPTAINFLEELNLHNHNYRIAHINSNFDDKSSALDPFKMLDPMYNQASQTWKYLNKEIKLNDYEIFNNFTKYSLGGLSVSWGAGCSEFSKKDIGANIDLSKYYKLLDNNVEVLNYSNNYLNKYLGSFSRFLKFHTAQPFFTSSRYVTYGYAKKAIHFKSKKSKKIEGCNLCEGCNTYCFNNSIYNASNDFLEKKNKKLKSYNASKVTSISKKNSSYTIFVTNKDKSSLYSLKCKIVVLAAGTVNSSKILLNYLNQSKKLHISLPIKHNHVVRCAFISLRNFKRLPPQPVGINIARTYFKNISSYTSLVFGSHIASSDLISFLPIKNNLIHKFIRILKKRLIISLTFFPSELSESTITYVNNNEFIIKGKKPSLFYIFYLMIPFLFNSIKNLMIPLSFQMLKPGSDLHHGGTFPIGSLPDINTSLHCELNNHKNLYIIDGSWLPRVSEKPHTYTLMANARRIARHILKNEK